MPAEDLPRESDILARYGGDEFVVVLPETPASGALVIAERIRKSIEAHVFLTEQGLAARPPGCHTMKRRSPRRGTDTGFACARVLRNEANHP